MIRILSVIFFVLAQGAIGATAATCSGANPVITRVFVQSVTPGPANQYHLVGTVVNMGSQHQGPNIQQFAAIYQYGIKLDEKGIPPLARLQSATFTYTWLRNPDAAKGSTTLDFKIDMVAGTNCNPNTYHLTF